MNEEIINILDGVKDGEKVLAYIEALEEHFHHHHHGEDCECGCHDEEEDEWKEIKTRYKNALTVKDWEKLLKNEKVFTKDALIVMKRMRHIAAPTTSMELADTFGCGAVYYSNETEKLAERLLPYVKADKLTENEYWTILFNGWETEAERCYAIRPELYEALGNVDLSAIPLRENDLF